MRRLIAVAALAVLAGCGDETQTTTTDAPAVSAACEQAMSHDATYTTSRSSEGEVAADQATLTACGSLAEWVAAEKTHDVAVGNTPPAKVAALFCSDAPAEVQQRQLCQEAFAEHPEVKR